MLLKMFDGRSYVLDTRLSADQRLKLVNDIIAKYKNYLESNWEDDYSIYAPKNVLSLLASYLCSKNPSASGGFTGDTGSDKILSGRQLSQRERIKEIPLGLMGEQSEKFILKFKEKHKYEQVRKNKPKYSQSKMHRMNTLFVPRRQRRSVDKYLYGDPQRYQVMIVKNRIVVRESDYLHKRKLMGFTSTDKRLPYIDNSKPYQSKWCYLNTDNEFDFDNIKYKGPPQYKYDYIFAIKQGEKLYFLDQNLTKTLKVEQIDKQ